MKRLKDFMLNMTAWRGIGGLIVSLGLATVGQVDAVIAVGVAIASAAEVIRGGAESGGKNETPKAGSEE
jgi:hypothetical protein